MPWYRSRSGQLIHAVGGLAAAHQARGAALVPDDEVDPSAAQSEADEAAQAAAVVDEAERKRAEAAKKGVDRTKLEPLGPKPTDPTPDTRPAPPKLIVEHDVYPELTPEAQKAVDDAVRDETPR